MRMNEEKKIGVTGRKELTIPECYSALITTMQGTENTRTARFNIFLLTNSIFLFTWANLFVSETPREMGLSAIVMGILCVLGAGSGIVGFMTGLTLHKYMTRLLNLVLSVEKEAPVDAAPYRDGVVPVQEECKQGRCRFLKGLGGYGWQFAYVPAVSVVLYVVLGLITVMSVS